MVFPLLLFVFGALQVCGQERQAVSSTKVAEQSKSAAPTPDTTVSPGTAQRNDLNLLGKTNTQSGESRRNENVQFNLIDNNALKELNVRLGTTATLVTEFRPERQYFGVEFGNSPPGLLHVGALPSQLGAVHGLLFYTHLNSVFSARSFFQVGAVRPARENQYGLNFVAPLWKGGFVTIDGTQGKIRGNVNGNVLVPRAEERSALVTDPALAAEINRFFTAYPLAPPNRTDIDQRALNTNAPQRINTDTASVRVDHIFRAKDRLTARHAWTTQALDAFQFVAGQNPDTTTKSHNARLTWQHVWSPGVSGDFTTGFDRVRSQLMPEPNAVGPQVQIGTAFTALGPNANVPLDRVQNRFRQAALVRVQRGSHNVTFGGELTRLRFNGREASSNRGNFYFRNDFGRDAITNFRLAVPSRYSTGLGELDRGFRRWEQQMFIGDRWQASARLTLSVGLRYEPVLAPSEVNNRTAITNPCDCNNLSPTFGFAYRLPGDWGVLRGAYGLHYSELFAITYQQLRWNPPEFQKIEVLVPDLLAPLKDAVISPNGRATLFVVPDELKAPYSHQYNFSWESQLPRNWRLQVGYVGSRTHKLMLLLHLNRALNVPGIPTITATVNDRRPDQRYFELRRIENASRAYFDAGRVTLVVPDWRNLTIDASYWFSKAIDTGAAYTNTAAGDDARQGYSQSQNLVAADLKGPSPFDQSHAMLVRLRYGIPSAPFTGRAARALLSKWNLSMVWLAKTGMPFTVITGSDSPGFGNVDGTNGDRPNLLDPSVLGRSVNHPDIAVQQLPRAAFAFLPVGAERGNLGRNTFRRAGFQNMNASLARTWSLAGERTLTLRAESINLTNSPQFADPNADLSSPAFGKITNTLNDGRTFQFTAQFRF